MKSLPILILTLIFLGFFAHCQHSKETSSELEEIERLASLYPDSAYKMLRNFDTIKLVTPHDSAIFRILTAETRYKTYHNDTNDVEISKAVEFFTHTDNRYQTMRSLYYQGIIRKFAHSYYSALQSLLLASEICDSLKNPFDLGNIYDQISTIYNKIGDHPSQNKYAELSWKNYVLSDSLPFIIQSQLYYGNSLCNMKIFDKAVPILEQAYELAMEYKDDELIDMAIGDLGNAYLWVEEYRKAKEKYADLGKRIGFAKMREHDLRLYLYTLVHLGEYNDTTDMIAEQLGKVVGKNKVNHEYFLHRNDYKEAFEAMKGMYDSLDNDMSKRRLDDTNLLLASYNKEKIKQTSLELRIQKKEKLWITLTSIIITFLIIIIGYYYMQRKKLKIRSLINETAILSQEYHLLLEKEKNQITTQSPSSVSDDSELIIDVKNSTDSEAEVELEVTTSDFSDEASDMENTYAKVEESTKEKDSEKESLMQRSEEQAAGHSNSYSSLFRPFITSTMESLDSLYSEYYISQGMSDQQRLVKLMESELNKLRNDNKFITALENSINVETNGLLEEVYASLVRVTFNQRKLVVFLYYGLSINMICLLLGLQPNAVYSRKNRLIQKINISTSERKDILIDKIKG